MKGRLSRGGVAVTAAILVGATAAAAATTLQSIVGSDGVIHGCFKSENGQLRLVSADDECRPSEDAIAWNQAGPQGVPGPKGDTGENGDPGAQGPPGKDGTANTPWDIIPTALGVVTPGVSRIVTVPCPTGDVILGGTFDQPLGIQHSSEPATGAAGWTYRVTNLGTTPVGPIGTLTFCGKG